MSIGALERRSNQSILKDISPGCSLEGLMLKLKLQYFGHLTRKTDSFEKTLMLGKIESGRRDDRGWDGWMASPTQWTWIWVDSGSWWWRRRPGVLWFMGLQRVGHDWATELNWTKITILLFCFLSQAFIILNIRYDFRTSLLTHTPKVVGPGLIPGQGTRFHMSMKSSHVATKKCWS